MKKTFKVVVDCTMQAQDATDAERIVTEILDGDDRNPWADLTYEIIETVMEGNDPE